MQTKFKKVGEYKIKEVFNEGGKDVKEVINDIFAIYFIDAYYKETNSKNG